MMEKAAVPELFIFINLFLISDLSFYSHLSSRTSVQATGSQFAAVTDTKLVSIDPLYLRVERR